jgi:RND family efflux transporter MFP subunit
MRDNHLHLRIILPLGLAAGAALFSGCHKSSGSAHNPQQAPPAAKVTVASVSKQDVVEWEEFTGRTEAIETVEVKPRVSGHIQKVHFQSGQMVKKGDVLFSIDARWHKAEFDRRQAEYQQATVRLETAEREARRIETLLANKAISKEEAEGRQARFNEAKAGLLAAEAARDSAKLDLDFTEIRAPIDGRVSRALVTQGNFISGVAGNATLLTTIVTVDPVYVYADFDENSLLKFSTLFEHKRLPLTDGKIPVQLQLGDEKDFIREGYIESLDNRLDANTGSILLRAIFPNADGRIVPGLFARIRVPLSERYAALMVEERSIGTDQGQKFVLALSSTNTVEYRPVKLGPVIDGKRIVRAGLNEGEEVVVNGLARVRPGMPVSAERQVAANEKELHTAQN